MIIFKGGLFEPGAESFLEKGFLMCNKAKKLGKNWKFFYRCHNFYGFSAQKAQQTELSSIDCGVSQN